MEYNGRVSHGHINRADHAREYCPQEENAPSTLIHILFTNSTDDLWKINWLVLINISNKRQRKPNHMQSMNAELSVLIDQPAHLFVNMLLLLSF